MKRSEILPEIFLVTGPAHSGKTTLATRLSEGLRQRGAAVGGFVCPGEFREGRRTFFHLADLESGKTRPLAGEEGDASWPRQGRFRFDPGALSEGVSLLHRGSVMQPSVLFVDEVGPMELRGEGWGDALDHLLHTHRGIEVWVVRDSLVREVEAHWEITPAGIMDVAEDALNEWIQKLWKAYLKQ